MRSQIRLHGGAEVINRLRDDGCGEAVSLLCIPSQHHTTISQLTSHVESLPAIPALMLSQVFDAMVAVAVGH